jgi:two-component system, OmpR family, sensor histidine kinase VicK
VPSNFQNFKGNKVSKITPWVFNTESKIDINYRDKPSYISEYWYFIIHALTIDSHETGSDEKTEVLYGADNAINLITNVVSGAKTMLYACVDSSESQVNMGKVESIRKTILDAKNRGVKLRYITEITNDNIQYWKDLMKIIDELRHLEGVKGNFVTNGTQYIDIALLQQTKPVLQVIYSNVKAVIDQNLYLFGTLWDKATPVEQKIREIEEGIEQEYFKVITDHEQASQILVELAKSLKQEALVVLPNDRSMVRLDKLGVVDYAIKAAQTNGADIKIICPLSEVNSRVVKKIFDKAPNIKILNGINCPFGIYIVDGQKFLRVEMRVAEAEIFSEAIGLAFYSNSRRSTESFKAVFGLLWNERILNEELHRADKMQKEFINVASHEIKTPTQAILAYSALLTKHPDKTEQISKGLYRNAERLRKLTDDILDVSRIESQTLRLNKEQFNLKDVISYIVEDFRSDIEEEGHGNIELIYEAVKKNNNNHYQDLLVQADKARITQVISNLLSNAIKHTKKRGGVICVTATVQQPMENDSDNEVLVSIKDTGAGIDSEILPRLFTKFATKSETGTGLGLFISKSIIEAHGGKIWAHDNSDILSRGEKIGATFSFTIPLGRNKMQSIA